MLSLPKKSDDQSETEPLWHPNFRNFERLPDTKVVRTTFFVNTASIAITLALAMWVFYREYHIRTLEQQIAAAEQQISSNTKQNAEALRLNKIFVAENQKVTEAENFLQAPISPSEFVKIIGQTLPKEIQIDYIETRNQAFVLRGLVAGTKDQASGSASTYVELLRANPRLSSVFETTSLDKLTPSSNSGTLSFEISLKVKVGGKK